MGNEFAPLATVVSALIAAAISFISLTLSKEQKTSEFRQKWIDGLRDDLAIFFAAVRAFARATQEHGKARSEGRQGATFSFTDEAISEMRRNVAETRYRIQLRLNENEMNHRELLRLMTAAVQKQQLVIEGHAQTEEVLSAVEAAANFAPQVLKAEWQRVKHGELPFRLVRNWIAPTVFLLGVGLAIALMIRSEGKVASMNQSRAGGSSTPAQMLR